ncbi:hypothetical protein LINPERPRIM_LOCUS20080 [Linum perenne]
MRSLVMTASVPTNFKCKETSSEATRSEGWINGQVRGPWEGQNRVQVKKTRTSRSWEWRGGGGWPAVIAFVGEEYGEVCRSFTSSVNKLPHRKLMAIQRFEHNSFIRALIEEPSRPVESG